MACLTYFTNNRCELRDREVDCREKDSEIRDLKEKVVNLVRQLELKKAELNRRENLMVRNIVSGMTNYYVLKTLRSLVQLFHCAPFFISMIMSITFEF